MECKSPSQEKVVYACNNCKLHVKTRYHCTVCDDFYLCIQCHDRVGHPHPIAKLGLESVDGSSPSVRPSEKILEKKRIEAQFRLDVLIHAYRCSKVDCPFPDCPKMKRMLAHVQVCKLNLKGDCSYCTRLIGVCLYHASDCKVTECTLPYCENIKGDIGRFLKVLRRKPGVTSPSVEPPTDLLEMKRTEVRHHIEILVHVSSCRNIDCPFPDCPNVKKMLEHVRVCKLSLEGDCSCCAQIIGVCWNHASSCKVTKCTLPYCEDIKADIARFVRVLKINAAINGPSPGVKQSADLVEQKTKEVRRHVQTLVHIGSCRNSNCPIRDCLMMKTVFGHTLICKLGLNGVCVYCTQLIGVCWYHARDCKVTKCTFMYCEKIKADPDHFLGLLKRNAAIMELRMKGNSSTAPDKEPDGQSVLLGAIIPTCSVNAGGSSSMEMSMPNLSDLGMKSDTSNPTQNEL